MPAPLPIEPALPELIAALSRAGRAVLQAPPGAGKTTRVPLALLESGSIAGRIVMLEPRRLATRAAAMRMAETLGEAPGGTVGYRIRGESRVSAATRIEVVTEGILTRMLQDDPGLAGVGAVIFDEFHERSLTGDLGLALAWEARGALRPDLGLLVMSATLDAAPVAALLDGAPVVTAAGRSFPVETRWLDAPVGRGTRLPEAAADLVARAVAETEGGVLVFLPGAGEIRRAEASLKGLLPADCRVFPLFGAMDFAAQRAAIAPAREGRKVVLATAIAETSLTIEDIRVVVDAGRARRARFDPGSGMSRLVTERVTRAEAEQRSGRAGRVAPGLCYRLWTKGEEGALAAYPPPEIAAADLSGLALELAAWGAMPGDLAFLTPPEPGAFAAARALLGDLGALDAAGRITGHGRALARLPLHPRLGHMLTLAGGQGAPLAALLADRDPLRGAPADLGLRLKALDAPEEVAAETSQSALSRIRREAGRLARTAPSPPRAMRTAEMAALAYPDRIGLRRQGEAARWILSGGRGARMDAEDPLAGARLLVAADLDGAGREATIRRAAPLSEAELRGLYAERIGWQDVCEWSRRERRVVARKQERFGALVLDDRIWRDVPPDRVAAAMLDGVRELGLPWTAPARRVQARVERLRAAGADLPDFSDAALMDRAGEWLLPFLSGLRTGEDLKAFDPAPALLAGLSHDQRRQLDRDAPAAFETPAGRRVPIDYAAAPPEVSLPLSEVFGVTEHPRVAGEALKLTLLSPAGRPVQVTTDLPGFWAGAYGEVRKEMRSRYPKHDWPGNPAAAAPARGPARGKLKRRG